MKRVFLTLMLVAGCGAGGDQANNSAAQAVQTSSLTGLYEGGSSPRPNQLCVIGQGSSNASFGLVVWGANLHSCSGSGTAVQDGNKLTLTMTGDESCTIDATIQDGNVTLPATVPEGCAYYCGAQAKLGGGAFAKKGGTTEEAMKATDLVGEPLCGNSTSGR